jgi:hypothetical protein
MQQQSNNTIDIDKLERALRDDNDAARSATRYFSRLLFSFAALVVALVVIAPIVGGEPVYSAAHPRSFCIRFAAAILTFVVIAGLRYRDARDPHAAALRLKTDFDKMTAPGWPAYVMKLGARMGLILGLTVASAMALVPTAEAPELSQRLPTAALFLVGTFAWTVPFAFFIRWLSVRSIRKNLRT